MSDLLINTAVIVALAAIVGLVLYVVRKWP